MKRQRFLIGALVVVLLLALAVAVTQGQAQQPEDGTSAINEPLAELNDVIPIQGRLTDENGVPLSGVFEMRFSIYDVASGGYALCSDEDNVGVDNGLFSAHITCNSYDIDGRQLWLGLKVGTDSEMTRRRPLYAVPYAWTLRPGASIVNPGTAGLYEVGLYAASGAAGGRGLYGHASTTAVDYRPTGVFGHADALRGIGVFGFANSGASSGYGGFFANVSTDGDLIAAADSISFSHLEFRVSNSGDVYADGSFHPGGMDFAELLPAVEGLEPGDVLVIGPDGQLACSSEAYQPTVVGVYSTKPGIVGGGEVGRVFSEMDLSSKAPLAVVGVVPVKASAENGAIQPGDLLVASATPGHAMRASPNPPVGTVLGKALAALDEGIGTIQILVMLQ
ncbi:MAG: hypothetical protein ACP5JJ_15675 [Anaerolineae bacterium]